MSKNLIAFMVCVAACIYTGLNGKTAESVICFILAAVNLMYIFFDMFMGGKSA